MKYSEDNINKVDEMDTKYINSDEDYVIEDDDSEECIYFITSDEERNVLNNSIYDKYTEIYAEFSSYFDDTTFIPVDSLKFSHRFSPYIYLFVDEENSTIYNCVR